MPVRPSLRVLAGLALVTACTLALQVVLTRLLSAVLAYHFSFLAISLALLGTGVGALLVYLIPGWFDRAPLESLLARWAAAFGVLLVVIPFGLVRLNFDQGEGVTAGFAVNLAAACVLAALPSLAAGVVVALAINGFPQHVGRVYAVDLVGAGLGALVVVPLMWLSDAPTLVVGLGLTSLVAALLFAPPVRRERLMALGFLGTGALVLVSVATTSVLFLPPRYNTPPRVQLTERWTPLSRVTGYDFPGSDTFAAVFYDRDYAPIPKVEGDDIPDWQDLGIGAQSIGYELTGPGDVLIIGGGGGRDIYNALSEGQRRIDVIELNEGIRKVVDEDLGHLSGSPYSRPRVHTTIGDGRGVLAARNTKYDTVHIGFTNTLTASSASGFVLSENNLYTLEAFDEYFDHVRPGGVLNLSRTRRFAGDEGLRATVLMLAALERQGIEDPKNNVVVILGHDLLGEEYATVLGRLEPFSADELDRIRQLADERADGLVFAPGGPYVDEWSGLEGADWQDFCSSYALDVCPPTDDKPFFFNMSRLGDIGGRSTTYTADPYDLLMLTLGILVILSLLGFLLPFRFARTTTPPTFTSLSYFAAIGLGFLLLEVALIQRFVLFLGYPTYALSVVLFSLLISTGIGSAISGCLSQPRRPLLIALTAVAVLAAIGAYGLQPLLRSMISAPFAGKVAITIALLTPLGIGLGVAMPIGLRRFHGLYPSSIPYAWGVNGIASVLASVLGVALAINFGFAVASLVAGACYLAALAHAALGRWPDATDKPLAVEAEPRSQLAVPVTTPTGG